MNRPDEEEEIDTDLAQSAGDSEKGYASAIAETWNHLEETKETQTELEEIFAPHREALAASGHTPEVMDTDGDRRKPGTGRATVTPPGSHGEPSGDVAAAARRD